MTPVEVLDPFSLTADTRLYVARAATEHALETLLAVLDRGERAAALTGQAGLGKTLLLHVLADRSSERWRPVYVPYAALSVLDLCSWVLSTLGEEVGASPQAALDGVAKDLQREGLGLLLLVDDAAALPMETARWLGRLVAGPGGPLALVVASGDRSGSSATLAALGRCEVVRLSEPMNDLECAEYIRARLGRARAPDSILARFDDASVRRLYAISGGNPRRLHIAASDLLRGGGGRVPEDDFDTASEPTVAIPGAKVEEE